MERYLIKVCFFNVEDLNAARSELVQNGIELADIDQLTISRSRGKHLTFGSMTRAPQLAVRFLPFGFILGLIIYLASVFTSSRAVGLWNKLATVNLFNLLFTGLLFGYVFLVVGYFFGKRLVVNTIEYTNKGHGKGQNILLVNVDEHGKEVSLNILHAYAPASLDIVDSKFEVEIGLRDQQSA